jgi:hypothetical protein
VNGLRATLAAIGLVALVAAIAVGRPTVLLPLGILGIAAFVVSAGCLAADLLPLRRRHAVCSALSLLAGLAIALGGQVSQLLELVPALLLIALQAVPLLTTRGLRLRAP